MKRARFLMVVVIMTITGGCTFYPLEGDNADSNDRIDPLGGSPVSAGIVVTECKYATQAGYRHLGISAVDDELDPNITALVGNFYLWSDVYVIPAECWFSDGHAQLRFRHIYNGESVAMYTYDETVGDCLGEDYPLDGNDWTRCAQNQTGLVTICRHGRTWNGTACR